MARGLSIVSREVMFCREENVKKSIFWSMVIVAFPMTILAVDYDYKETKDFKTLEETGGITVFEESFAPYVKDCLDNTFGGTGGIPCLLVSELWGREVGIYLARVKKDSRKEALPKLVALEEAWNKSDEGSIELNSSLMDKIHDTRGTMYQLMRAGNVDRIFTSINKKRTVMLRLWHLMASGKENGELKPATTPELADKALNIAYKDLKKVLNEDRRKLLLTAQRAWLKARDAVVDYCLTQFGQHTADYMLSYVVSSRTLLLNEWAKIAVKKPDSEM